MGFLESKEESLEPGKVSEELVDSENPHDLHEADNLAGLANDLVVLQIGEGKRYVNWDKGKEVQ